MASSNDGCGRVGSRSDCETSTWKSRARRYPRSIHQTPGCFIQPPSPKPTLERSSEVTSLLLLMLMVLLPTRLLLSLWLLLLLLLLLL